jgi:hypothetical protein
MVEVNIVDQTFSKSAQGFLGVHASTLDGCHRFHIGRVRENRIVVNVLHLGKCSPGLGTALTGTLRSNAFDIGPEKPQTRVFRCQGIVE